MARPRLRTGLCNGLLGLGLVCAACRAERPPSRVHVRVTGAHASALPGAALFLDGRPVARSDGEGQAWLAMPRDVTGRMELRVECPEGFEAPAPRMLRVRHSGARTLVMACEARHRRALLAVRARGAEGLPVRVNGERIGEVGADGTLHVQLVREVGSELRVAVDTRSRPALRPQSPVVKVRLDEDEIVLVDHSFEEAKRVRRRKKRAAPPAVNAPRRLRTL